MPRRQFLADLQKLQTDVQLKGVCNIKPGDDDGQFQFEIYARTSEHAPPIALSITAVIPDLSDYPKTHQYMIFCGEDAPPHIAEALQNIRGSDRKTVLELIEMVSICVTSLVPDRDGDTTMKDSQFFEDDEQYEEDSDADDIYPDDDEDFGFAGAASIAETPYGPATPTTGISSKDDKPFRDRVRSDLRAAKDSGFKIGHLGPLLKGYSSFVTVSVRMSKLGLSEEAMKAWRIFPSDYFILLLQYPNGYKSNERLQNFDTQSLKGNLGIRVCASKKYKPTLQEAIKAFTRVRGDSLSSAQSTKDASTESSTLREIFISKPLSKYLEDSLVPILRFRGRGMDWAGAESCLNDMQCAILGWNMDAVPDKYYEPEAIHKSFLSIMHGDHYRQRDVTKHSFPLLAVQFALRHFARCTEFCMVCHTKLDSQLEAIKPYVCENPLCLFQYMALGLGPSIEHEIMTQPYVVDLLVSFCYASAKTKKLKDFPNGLNLKVPPLFTDLNAAGLEQHDDPKNKRPLEKAFEKQQDQRHEIEFDRERREIMFKNKPEGGCPINRGQWIVIECKGTQLDQQEELHCRVSETTFYPTVSTDEPVVLPDLNPAGPDPIETARSPRQATKSEKTLTPAPTPRWATASLTIYSQEFESLQDSHKYEVICKLLDTLPDVKEMRSYLASQNSSDLRNWTARMSPAATSLLRWIITSNRACIMQVESGNSEDSDGRSTHKEERLHGMEGYMQFRFAMGAPDKETRFKSEVSSTTERLNLSYPTIFAWHGSPLYNWHMIIREGLHFKNIKHGRAYGDGVYHAKDAGTSTGYTGGSCGYWQKSLLRISSALALNEIVNAPKEFVSSNPYLVVSQLDWIQTRYLLVRCSPPDANIKPGIEAMPTSVHPQDPANTPKGPNRQPITIPASAIKSVTLEQKLTPAGKRSSTGAGGPSKKLKDGLGTSLATAIDVDADTDGDSVCTEVEDLEILFDEEPVAGSPMGERDSTTAAAQKLLSSSDKGKGASSAKTPTDFVPSTLDFNTLPMMPTPKYATPATTKRLQAELKTLAKIQSSTDPAALGWFIDFEKMDNIYQWIVELHSFHTFIVKDKPLPLAEDMKKAGVTSIVLEIRFGPEFPFSPPYIRVIRPRFLPFQLGGGGHVVIGGAMCMELLTNTGWSGILGMESVLMQVRMAIASEPFARLEGKGAKVKGNSAAGDYGAAEAAQGYTRACANHGWTVPPGFKEVAYGMNPAAEAGNGDAAAGQSTT